MSNLQVNNQFDHLPEVQREFVKLRVGNKAIKDLSTSVVKRACADIIAKMIFDSQKGRGETQEELNQIIAFQTEALFSELRRPFNNLTLPELQEAFRRGVRDAAGRWFGVCPTTYHQFLKWFYNLPERQKSWVDYLDQIEEKKQPVTIDKVMFSKQSCLNAFKRYKEAGVMPFGAFAYYDIINELIGSPYQGKGEKTIIHDTVLRKEIVKRLTEKHTAEMLIEKKRQEKRGNLGMAESLMSSITAEFKDSESLKKLIKAEFLKVFFDKLISENKELVLTD